MRAIIDGISISCVAAAIPSDVFELSRLAREYGEHYVDRAMASTGISAVRLAPASVRASDLCVYAASAIMEAGLCSPDEIDGLVFVSQTPDDIAPATGIRLLERLGIDGGAVAFDINYGCSGYVYSLYQAAMMVRAGCCGKVLVCAGDVISPYIQPDDSAVRMVFGDGGSATVIESGRDSFAFVFGSDADGARSLRISDGAIRMDGMAIFNFALREVPPTVTEVLELKGWAMEDVGAFALHQANGLILEYLRKKMRISPEAYPIALDGYGNTGPASIPLVLCARHAELAAANRLDKAVLCGFGSGLSWGAVALDLSQTAFLNPVELAEEENGQRVFST
jgi:3-oxoacyl-[acyl-carrier-protein] synthase-3